MKFKTFLAIYKNLIILVWWIVILIIFKVTTNFEFSHGNSLIFVFLMFALPLTLYIFGLVYKKKLLKAKALKKGPYIDKIKNDYKNKILQKEFSNNIKNLAFAIEQINDEVVLDNPHLLIVFQKERASLHLKETKIYYYYYYSLKVKEYCKYDKKLLQYNSTIYLYHLIIEKLNTLIEHPLNYIENKKNFWLVDSITSEVLYTNAKGPFKKKRSNQVKEINLLTDN